MAVLYLNLCNNEVCYKGTVLKSFPCPLSKESNQKCCSYLDNVLFTTILYDCKLSLLAKPPDK